MSPLSSIGTANATLYCVATMFMLLILFPDRAVAAAADRSRLCIVADLSASAIEGIMCLMNSSRSAFAVCFRRCNPTTNPTTSVKQSTAATGPPITPCRTAHAPLVVLDQSCSIFAGVHDGSGLHTLDRCFVSSWYSPTSQPVHTRAEVRLSALIFSPLEHCGCGKQLKDLWSDASKYVSASHVMHVRAVVDPFGIEMYVPAEHVVCVLHCGAWWVARSWYSLLLQLVQLPYWLALPTKAWPTLHACCGWHACNRCLCTVVSVWVIVCCLLCVVVVVVVVFFFLVVFLLLLLIDCVGLEGQEFWY